MGSTSPPGTLSLHSNAHGVVSRPQAASTHVMHLRKVLTRALQSVEGFVVTFAQEAEPG